MAALDNDAYEEDDKFATCFCGVQLLGFLFGFIMGYIGSLGFHHDPTAISILMSIGITVGLKANDGYNPSENTKGRKLAILLATSFTMVRSMLWVLGILVDEKSDFCVMLTAFIVSGMVNFVKIILKIVYGSLKFKEKRKFKEEERNALVSQVV